MSEYLENMAQPYSWQTTTQLHFLRSHACLFVGSSMTDVNMLRMLQYAGRPARLSSVYAIVPEEGGNSAGGEHALGVERLWMRLQATLFEHLGVRLIVASGYGDVPDKVREVTSKLDEGRATAPKT